MKKSFFERSFELTKMAAKIGLRELSSGDLPSRIQQARILVESLSQLKGAAMKAGQLLSIEAAEYFPPEAMEILSQLQNAATAESFAEIDRRLTLELGPEKRHAIEMLSQEPVASASIAQVHSARIAGAQVAIKVQHAGVAEAIESDLALLKKAATAFCRLSGRKMNLDRLFEEFQSVLLQEVDFTTEAELLERYRKRLTELNAGHEDEAPYAAPTVWSDYSTQQILTMSWEDGETLTEWLSRPRTRAARERVAHLLLKLYCHEFFVWGLVQTDPNFSNFLIREAPQGLQSQGLQSQGLQLVLLDFGATRVFEEKMVVSYVKLIDAVIRSEYKSVLTQAIDFGLLDPRESEETKTNFIEMMKVSAEPFKPKSGDGGFDFSNREYTSLCRDVVTRFAKTLTYSPPPHQIVFLHRKLGGIFALLQRLEVEISIAPYWENIVSNSRMLQNELPARP